MRLLIVSSEFPPGPGGIGTHSYQLAHHLGRMGWEAAVATSQDYCSDEEVEGFNRRQPFPIVRFRSVRSPLIEAFYRLRVVSNHIREQQPDIIVASGDRAVMLVSWISWRHGLPWVAVGHGVEFGVSALWERCLTRLAFRRAAAVVCVSAYTKGRMGAAGIVPRVSRVIHNGADPLRFTVLAEDDVRRFRARLGLADARLLLTVGNVTDRKGQEVVIRALPAILRAEPATHYLMAGLPTEREGLETLARKLGVADHVGFRGLVCNEELVLLLNSCDVFVMTSRRTADGDFEGYGIAVVEAALCGKPSVVSAGSGLEEAIEEGETGIAVPENGEAETARTIVSLLQNDERRLSMGLAARQRALREQTWEHRIREYDALLRSILGNARTDSIRVLDPESGGVARRA